MTTTWPAHRIILNPNQWSFHFSNLQKAFQALKETNPYSADFNRFSIEFDQAAARSKPLSTALEGWDYTIQASVDLKDESLRIIQCLWETDSHTFLGRWELVSSDRA